MVNGLIMRLILFVLDREAFICQFKAVCMYYYFFILFLLDFIRLIITNSIIVRSLHSLQTKSILMKSSLFSILAIFITVIVCTIFLQYGFSVK